MTVDPTKDPTYVDVSADWEGKGTRCDPFLMNFEGRTSHKMLYFNAPYISLLEEGGDGYHELYLGGCDGRLFLPPFIKNVLSLYKWEAYQTLEGQDYKIHTVEMYDSEQEVDDRAVRELAEKLNEFRTSGPTLAHCQAGLNRSSLIAGASLVLTGRFTAKEAIDLMRERRSNAVLCNQSFEDYLLAFKE